MERANDVDTNSPIAFNAALVIFGSILVYHRSQLSVLILPEPVEGCQTSFNDAIEALRLLDDGNYMVQRCTDYLERLAHMLDTNAYLRGDASADQAQPSGGHVFSGAQSPVQALPVSDTWVSGALSPFQLDLGEFMATDSDLSYLFGTQEFDQ